MAGYNHQQVPFWDFVRAFDDQQNGAGVDHQPSPPPFGFFGPPPHGPHSGGFFGPPQHGHGPFGWRGPHEHGRGGFGGRGRHGHHGRRDHGPPGEGQEEHDHQSRTASPSGEEAAEGEAANASGNEERHEGRRGRGRCGRGGPGGFGPRGGRGHHEHGHGHGYGHGFHGRHGGPRGPWERRGPPPAFGGPGAFDLSGLFASLNAHPAVAGHPWAQMFRNFAEQAGMVNPEAAERSGETLANDNEEENSFIPPIDVFSTETAYILHVALPGAKKEDVGVNWDADKGELNVAGVIYRKGDEEFLKTLAQSERKVGVFERSVKLPPGNEEKEEVDGDAIAAKLEDGVLIVTVPKVEKEWTEVKRVDVQ